MAEVGDSGKGYLRTATIVPDHILKGETHHGTMYDASSVGSEWESVSSGNTNLSDNKRFDELPSEHKKINFQRAVEELTQYYLRPTEE
mgnify:CR=1 FL=1